MDTGIRDRFVTLWRKHFNQAELPIVLFYANDSGNADAAEAKSTPMCLIDALSSVRQGKTLAFDKKSIACPGGKKYAGYNQNIMPNFEYFLSCGLPGKLEGERYKKTPVLVKEIMKHAPAFVAPARFAIFKRWDLLQESDNPEVVIFFARPDVLSGLFTLANFDEAELHGVLAPFGSGCSSIIQHPYLEGKSSQPRAIIGMFDISARLYVEEDVLTFAVPINKFIRMISNMEESFLITRSWRRVQERLP